MKIAYLSYGENIHDIRFLEKMVEFGHEPFLISYYGNNLVNVKGVKNYKFNHRSLYAFNKFVTPFINYQLGKGLAAFQVAVHLKKLLKELKIDILHSNFIHYEGFCGALSGFHPVISMPWGSDVLINPDQSFFYKKMAQYTLKKADLIACDCELVKNKIISLTGVSKNKIEIFPCGIDLSVFCHSDNLRKTIREKLGWVNNKILIMNRSFKLVYGIEYFIESIPMIIKKCPEVRIILVGDGQDKDKHIKRIEELNIKDYIYLTGYVSVKEMVGYLNAADVYVSTSLSDGTSVSLLEAFACGLPVVVTNIPANLEWVTDGENGFLVSVKESKSISDAILNLVEDKKLLEKFSNINLKIAKEKGDWNKNYAKLEAMYQKLV